jgi:hypothetical protein
MSSNRYKLLGYIVWQGGKWYLRRQLPRPRTVLLVGATAATGLITAGILAKRLAS